VIILAAVCDRSSALQKLQGNGSRCLGCHEPPVPQPVTLQGHIGTTSLVVIKGMAWCGSHIYADGKRDPGRHSCFPQCLPGARTVCEGVELRVLAFYLHNPVGFGFSNKDVLLLQFKQEI
jgi:hypothetical protein